MRCVALLVVVAADYMDMFAPKGIENVDLSKIEAPSTERVLQLLMHNLVKREKTPQSYAALPYGVYDQVTDPNQECISKLEHLYGAVVQAEEAVANAHANFT